jgi:hypothetical protein
MDHVFRNTSLPRLGPLEHPTTEQHDEILRQLLEFNAGIVGPTTRTIRDSPYESETEAIEGGWWGEASYDCIFLYIFFAICFICWLCQTIFEARVIGSALLKKAEAHCKVADTRHPVRTFSFQAPDFYEKLGL